MFTTSSSIKRVILLVWRYTVHAERRNKCDCDTNACIKRVCTSFVWASGGNFSPAAHVVTKRDGNTEIEQSARTRANAVISIMRPPCKSRGTRRIRSAASGKIFCGGTYDSQSVRPLQRDVPKCTTSYQPSRHVVHGVGRVVYVEVHICI